MSEGLFVDMFKTDKSWLVSGLMSWSVSCILSSEVSTEDAMKKLEKRNNETTLSDARARYLQRKQQRQQSKASWQKGLCGNDLYPKIKLFFLCFFFL